MSRYLAVMLLTLAAAGALAAPSVTKCESDRDILYTAAASCPPGYTNTTRAMRGSVVTVPRSSPSARKDELAYVEHRAQIARQIQEWSDRDADLEWRALRAFWAQCQILDFQARARERLMFETEYPSRAARYREGVRAVRTLQLDMGCF